MEKPAKPNLPDDDALLYPVVASNSYQTKAPHFRATGFRTAQLTHCEREQLDHPAERFLVNSNLRRNDPETETSISAYLADNGVRMVALTGHDDMHAFERVALPAGTPLDMALGAVMAQRRSARDFTGDPLHINTLSTLLRAAGGISATATLPLQQGGTAEFSLRTVPSGGGLQPVALTVAALNITGLARGIYRYLPRDDRLAVLGDRQKLDTLLTAFAGPVDMVKSSRAAAIILFTAKPWRSIRKYGNRGLRFVIHETGGMAQNLHLAASALGAGSVDCASFYEEEIHAALQMDGVCEAALHTTLLGRIA